MMVVLSVCLLAKAGKLDRFVLATHGRQCRNGPSAAADIRALIFIGAVNIDVIGRVFLLPQNAVALRRIALKSAVMSNLFLGRAVVGNLACGDVATAASTLAR